MSGGRPVPWLNRSTAGVALASFFSDVSHELGTAVLPMVLLALGAGPAALGLVEGGADALATLAKVWGGLAADRADRRKPLASVGYLVTALGMAAIALCTAWWQVLACRIVAWVGRGSRSAPRDVLMLDATPPEGIGRAFGMERAADALGAVVGPLVAAALLGTGAEPGHIMLWSLAPGLLAFLSIAFLVTERPRPRRLHRRKLLAHFRETGRPFRRYLSAVLLFGCGDFSRTLLILFATKYVTGDLFSLSGGTLAIALYVLHNAVSAAMAFPLGWATDHLGRGPVLLSGYFLGAVTSAGFALLPPTPPVVVMLFLMSGTYIACQEVAEKALAADLLPAEVKATGMGMLAATNGIGDFLSSAVVGVLWSLFPDHPGIGFGAGAALQLAGASLLGFRWSAIRPDRGGEVDER